MDVIVGKGNLNGRGVYAHRNFEEGEIVIQYNLTPLSQKEFEQLNGNEKMFTHVHRKKIFLYGAPERYVNHSNNPNTKQDLIKKADIALRKIEKGEMITTDSEKDDI